MKEISEEPVVTEPSAPTLEERVGKLTGSSHLHWRKTGDVDAAEALMPKISEKPDVRPASSPGPTSETPETVVESEAASEPAEDEQPQLGETSEQKAERKRRNDIRRLRDYGKVRENLAAERRHRELLEKQLAESKGASAPPQTEEKPAMVDSGKPRRPRISDFDDVDDYEAAMDTYEDAKAKYDNAVADQRDEQRKMQSASQAAADKWESVKKAGRTKYNDFDAIAFNDQIPASLPVIAVLQERDDGHELAYYLGKNKDSARLIAEASDDPAFQSFQTYGQMIAHASAHPDFAMLLGEKRAIAKLELNRIAELIKAASSPKPNARPLPRPTAEVTVQNRGSAVEDELEDAIKRGDQTAYNRIMNKRDLERAGVR